VHKISNIDKYIWDLPFFRKPHRHLLPFVLAQESLPHDFPKSFIFESATPRNGGFYLIPIS
jgi:hypothetical protein